MKLYSALFFSFAQHYQQCGKKTNPNHIVENGDGTHYNEYNTKAYYDNKVKNLYKNARR